MRGQTSKYFWTFLATVLANEGEIWYNDAMKCIFLYNPHGGRGKIAKKLPYIIKRLRNRYETVDVYASKAPGDFTRRVREFAEVYDCIVFSGGDGTFNEILQGVGSMEQPPLLGYIPGGTVNDVAHSLGIPRYSLRRALNVILDGRVERLDCMTVNNTHYAMYSVSAGAFTSASYTTPQKTKRSLGAMAYGLEGVRKNLLFRVFPIRARSQDTEYEGECVFALAMNGRCVAGLRMNPGGSMCDGSLEGVVIRQKKDPTPINRLRALLTVAKLFLFGYHFKQNNISHFPGGTIRFEVPDDVVWNFDGERGVSGSIEVSVLERRIPLLVPKKAKHI